MLFFIIIFAVFFTVVACHLLIKRYCKGRGVSEAEIVEPRRIDREYSQSSHRDATQQVPYTEDLGVSITSGRRSRANVRSDRSDVYKLELQPDSQERKAASLEDDEDEYEEEDYSGESGEQEAEEDDSSSPENALQEEMDQAKRGQDNRV